MVDKTKTTTQVDAEFQLGNVSFKDFEKTIEKAFASYLSRLGAVNVDLPINLKPQTKGGAKAPAVDDLVKELRAFNLAVQKSANGKDATLSVAEAAKLNQVISTMMGALQAQPKRFSSSAQQAHSDVAGGRRQLDDLSKHMQARVREVEAYRNALLENLKEISKLGNSLRPIKTRAGMLNVAPVAMPELRAVVKQLEQQQRDFAKNLDPSRRSTLIGQGMAQQNRNDEATRRLLGLPDDEAIRLATRQHYQKLEKETAEAEKQRSAAAAKAQAAEIKRRNALNNLDLAQTKREAREQEQAARRQLRADDKIMSAENTPIYRAGKGLLSSAGFHPGNLAAEDRAAALHYAETRLKRVQYNMQQPGVSGDKLRAYGGEADKLTSTVDVLRREMRGNLGIMHDIQTGMRQFLRYAVLYGTGYRALSAAGAQIGESLDLDKQLKSIKAISQASNESMAAIESAIKRTGETSEKTLTDIAAGAQLLAQAGVEAGKLPEYLGTVSKLASATGTDIKDTAGVLTSLKEVFDKFDVSQLGDQLAQAVNISKLNVPDLSTILNYTASTAAQNNIGPQQLLGLSATLSNRGVRSSTIATGLRQAMLELFSPDKETLGFLSRQYSRIGAPMGDAAIKAQFQGYRYSDDPMGSVLTELKRLGVTGASRNEFSRVVDVRAENVLLPLLDNLEKVSENIAKVAQSGTAAAGAATQMEAVSNAAQKLWNSFVTLNHEMASAFFPLLTDMMNGLSGIVQGLRQSAVNMKIEEGAGGLASTGVLGAMVAAATIASKRLEKFSLAWRVLGGILLGGLTSMGVLAGKGTSGLIGYATDVVAKLAGWVLTFRGISAFLTSGALKAADSALLGSFGTVVSTFLKRFNLFFAIAIPALVEITEMFNKADYVGRLQEAKKKLADQRSKEAEIQQQFSPYLASTEGGVRSSLSKARQQYGDATALVGSILGPNMSDAALDQVSQLGAAGLEAGSPEQKKLLSALQATTGATFGAEQVRKLTEAGVALTSTRAALFGQLTSELEQIQNIYQKADRSEVEQAKIDAFEKLSSGDRQMLFSAQRNMPAASVKKVQETLDRFYATIYSKLPEKAVTDVEKTIVALTAAGVSSGNKEVLQQAMVDVHLAIEQGLVDYLRNLRDGLANSGRAANKNMPPRPNAGGLNKEVQALVDQINQSLPAAEQNRAAIEKAAQDAEAEEGRRKQRSLFEEDVKRKYSNATDESERVMAESRAGLLSPALAQQIAEAQRTKDFAQQKELAKQQAELTMAPLREAGESLLKTFQQGWALQNNGAEYPGDLSSSAGVLKALSSDAVQGGSTDVRDALSAYSDNMEKILQAKLQAKEQVAEIEKAEDLNTLELQREAAAAEADVYKQELELAKKRGASAKERAAIAKKMEAAQRRSGSLGSSAERVNQGVKDLVVGGTNITRLAMQLEDEMGLPAGVVMAMIGQESGGNPNAVSSKGAGGLMQLMPGTAAGLARKMGVKAIDTPELNVRAGAMYFKEQLDKFGSLELALAAYNAGPAAVSRHKGVPPYVETQGYVYGNKKTKGVLARMPLNNVSADRGSLIDTRRAMEAREADLRAQNESQVSVQRELRDKFRIARQSFQLQEKLVDQAVQQGNTTGLTDKLKRRNELAQLMLDEQEKLLKATADEAGAQEELAQLSEQRKFYHGRSLIQIQETLANRAQIEDQQYNARMTSEYPLTPELMGFRRSRGINMLQSELLEQSKYRLGATQTQMLNRANELSFSEKVAGDLRQQLAGASPEEAARIGDALQSAERNAANFREQINALRSTFGELQGDVQRFGATWSEEVSSISLRNVVADLQQSGFALGDFRKNIESAFSGYVQNIGDVLGGYVMRGFMSQVNIDEVRNSFMAVAEASQAYSDTVVQRAQLLYEIKNSPDLLKEDPYIRGTIINQATQAQAAAEKQARIQVELAEIEQRKVLRQNSLMGQLGDASVALTQEMLSTTFKTFITDGLAKLVGFGKRGESIATPLYVQDVSKGMEKVTQALTSGSGSGGIFGGAIDTIKGWLGIGQGTVEAAKTLSGALSSAAEGSGWATPASLGGASKGLSGMSGGSAADNFGSSFGKASSSWGAEGLTNTTGDLSSASGATAGAAKTSGMEDAGAALGYAGMAFSAASSGMSIASTVSNYQQSVKDYNRVMGLIQQRQSLDANYGKFAGFDANGNPTTARTDAQLNQLARASSRGVASPLAAGAQAPAVNIAIKNVNALDKDTLTEHMASGAGEKVILNTISRNKRDVKYLIEQA
jgi:TP901 family phage tail tape measure protein